MQKSIFSRNYSIYAIILSVIMHFFEEEARFAERLKSLKGEQYEKASIGNEIRKLRRNANMPQKALAKKLGTAQSVIARIEQGKQNLTLKMLVRTANAFGKRLDVRFRR